MTMRMWVSPRGARCAAYREPVLMVTRSSNRYRLVIVPPYLASMRSPMHLRRAVLASFGMATWPE